MMPLNMLTRFLAAFALLTLLALPQGQAFACPPGTVFSARDGNGLCLKRGQGLTVAARCASIKKNARECPAGWAFQSKASDRKNNYCCPTQAATAVRSCDLQCAPLLTSVTPQEEANRVHYNCMNLCAGSKMTLCPDGRFASDGRC